MYVYEFFKLNFLFRFHARLFPQYQMPLKSNTRMLDEDLLVTFKISFEYNSHILRLIMVSSWQQKKCIFLFSIGIMLFVWQILQQLREKREKYAMWCDGEKKYCWINCCTNCWINNTTLSIITWENPNPKSY